MCARPCVCVCARVLEEGELSALNPATNHGECARNASLLFSVTPQGRFCIIWLHERVWSDIEEDAFLKTQNRTSLSSLSTVSIRTFWTCYHSTGITLTISPCVDTSPDRRGFAQFPTDQIMTHFTLLGWVFPSILFALIFDHNTNC